jgi:catalase (peroxidase I)
VWVEQVSELGETKQYSNGDLVMGKLDIVLRDDSDMRKVVDGFAQDGMGFAEVFAESWVKLMNADRFDGACS